jgi:thiamine-monophosphate kinase
MVTRSGARAGDRIMVTGTIGDAALGLIVRKEIMEHQRWKLDRQQQSDLVNRYLLPQPRNALADAVRLHASAAMDVSDGLVGDLAKLCAASGVSAEVTIDNVPLSDAAKRVLAADSAQIEPVLTGGDDYEIVCTVAADKLESFRAAASKADVPVSEVGWVIEGKELPRFVGRNGKPMLFRQTSFSHF